MCILGVLMAGMVVGVVEDTGIAGLMAVGAGEVVGEAIMVEAAIIDLEAAAVVDIIKG